MNLKYLGLSKNTGVKLGFIAVLVSLLLFFSGGCNKKREVQRPANPTYELELQIADYRSGELVSGAVVHLFKTWDDWFNRVNPVVASKITNAEGRVVFSNLPEQKYYFFAEKDCRNNMYGAGVTKEDLQPYSNNFQEVTIIEFGTLQFTNTTQDAYEIYVDGKMFQGIAGNEEITLKYSSPGDYQLRALQTSNVSGTPKEVKLSASLGCGETVKFQIQ